MWHPRRNLWTQMVSGTFIGAACLWLSLRNIDFQLVITSVERVSWPWIALAVVGVILVSGGKAVRWQWLYPDSAPATSWTSHFSILLIAQMLNLLVPIRLGELARMGLLQQERRPAGMTLGTIVVEKSLDLLAVGMLLFVSVPMALLPGWLRPKAGPAALLTGAALLGLLFLISLLRQPLLKGLRAIPVPTREPWLHIHGIVLRLAQATLDGITGVERKRLIPVLGLTAVVWLISAGVIQVMLLAFGGDVAWQKTLVLMLALTFSNLVPTPPALIGLVGVVTEAVLVPFGMPVSQALALGTVLNGVLVVPPVLLGGWMVGVRIVRLILAAKHEPLSQVLGLSRTEPPAPET